MHDLGCIPAREWITVALVAILKNSRHEKFAQGVASGLSASQAYRQVVGVAAGKNADVMADQLMNQHGVRERIAELKEANSRKATLTREQAIEFLCNVIMASAAKIEEDSPLVQSAEFVDGKPVKLGIPDKIAAVKELTKICAWAQPSRLELSATDTLADFISSIRRAERPRHPVMENHAEANRGSAYAPLQETKSTVL